MEASSECRVFLQKESPRIGSSRSVTAWREELWWVVWETPHPSHDKWAWRSSPATKPLLNTKSPWPGWKKCRLTSTHKNLHGFLIGLLPVCCTVLCQTRAQWEQKTLPCLQTLGSQIRSTTLRVRIYPLKMLLFNQLSGFSCPVSVWIVVISAKNLAGNIKGFSSGNS